jgi:hypothetical protein
MTHLRRLSIVALAAVLLVVPGGASAQTPTLDQSQSTLAGGQQLNGPEASYAQTFRAGLSGGLPQVELAVELSEEPPPGPLRVELQSTNGGEPSDQVLATASLPASMVPSNTNPEFVQFQLQPVVPITAGTLYALTLQAPDSSDPSYVWGPTRLVTLTRPERRCRASPARNRSGWKLAATSPSRPTSTRLGSARPARRPTWRRGSPS